MKCDYCEKEVLYSMGFIGKDKTTDIQTCDKHKGRGLERQRNLSLEEENRELREQFNIKGV